MWGERQGWPQMAPEKEAVYGGGWCGWLGVWGQEAWGDGGPQMLLTTANATRHTRTAAPGLAFSSCATGLAAAK